MDSGSGLELDVLLPRFATGLTLRLGVRHLGIVAPFSHPSSSKLGAYNLNPTFSEQYRRLTRYNEVLNARGTKSFRLRVLVSGDFSPTLCG